MLTLSPVPIPGKKRGLNLVEFLSKFCGSSAKDSPVLTKFVII